MRSNSSSRMQVRPRLETLEFRLVPAVLLNYGGPGSVLNVQELVSGATPSVTISEPSPNQLLIDLGSNTFDRSSTSQATGLTYEIAGSPSTSHHAIVNISAANNITKLQTALPGDALTLGPVADTIGGLGNITASASVITVAGIDTSHASVGNGNVNLTAAGSLTVAPNAAINTGAGTLALGAGLNADDSASTTAQTSSLVLSSGSTSFSTNSTPGAITLRGDNIVVDTSSDGALVGSDGFLGGSPIATLGGVSSPPAMALDAHGNLYVVDQFGGAVTVFAAGSSVPTGSLGGLDLPNALAFDPSGNLFVVNEGDNSVARFAPGASTPSARLTGLNVPSAVAVDAQGNVYVANSGATTISVFAPGATTPTSTLTGLPFPTLLAFDSRGYLFEGNSGSAIDVFAPGAAFPTYQLAGGPSTEASAVAFDANDNVYVADTQGNSVSVYAPNAMTPFRTITGLNSPSHLAVDARGNLYVLGSPPISSVTLVAPGATAPTSQISGLNNPRTLLYDSIHNTLDVADASSVRIYGLHPTAGGVVIRTSSPDQPISLGEPPETNAGLSLSEAALAQIFTTSTGVLTVGDQAQTGAISFGGVGPSTAGASVVAIQSPTGPGAILLAPGHTAASLNTGIGNISLSAGTGGILNTNGPFESNLATSGSLSLDTTGGIGTSSNPLTFNDATVPSSVTIGATNMPASEVFLSAPASLALADVRTANTPLDVVVNSDLTVLPGAIVDTGTGTLSFSAGVNGFGGPSGAGTLSLGAGAGLVSRSTSAEAITLRAYALDIAGGAIPATVGLARGIGVSPVPVAGGVVVTSSDPAQPILIGADSGSGLILSKSLLAQIFTTATGTVTFGDPSHNANITFATVTPATTPGAGVAAMESGSGGGAIVLDSTVGTALGAGTGAIHLAAGSGGIIAQADGTSLATTGPVSLDSAGGIGSATARLLFDQAPPSLLTIGSNTAPASGVYLSAPGSLTLGQVATNNAALDVTTAVNLTVTPGAVVDTGAAPLSLAAGVNADGSPSNGGGTLALESGADVISANTGTNAITLRAAHLVIDTSDVPVLIGATPGTGSNAPTPVAGGVQLRTTRPDLPISLGSTNAASGLVLSSDQLAQIYTTAGGTLSFGDPSQTGNITFAAVTPAGASSVVAIQSPTGAGAIILDSTAGTSLGAGQHPISLAAGTGGILALGGGVSLSTSASVTLDTTGGIGSSSDRVVLDGSATFAVLTIGTTSTPASGVYIGGQGGVTIGNVRTADARFDVTGAMFVAVSPSAAIDTGTGKLSLAAGVNPDESPAGGIGVLGIQNGSIVVSRNPDQDAITLRGANMQIATGATGAYVGALPAALSTTPTETIAGLSGPTGMALDAQGNLYVSNFNSNSVSVFMPGSSTPFETLTGLNGPGNMAFDETGNLYVVNNNDNTVSAFAPGATTPTWTLTGLATPGPIAVDARGFIYVGNFDTGTVSIFAPKSTSPFQTLAGLSVPTSLAFDQFGNLYVANAGANTVSVFGPGGTLINTLTGVNTPLDIASDAQGNLYVVNNTSPGTVSVFAPGSSTPTSTLTGLDGPRALALDAVGNLYVSNQAGFGPVDNTVSVFAPGSTTPTASLTGLDAASSLVFDSQGRLLAANGGNNTISVYSAPTPVPLAGGVTLQTNQPAEPITIGASSGTGLTLSDAELARLFAMPGGGVTIGDTNQVGDITVTGPVFLHSGYDTLTLETAQGAINAATTATLAVANLALEAGSGIGATGPVATDATHLAFASQSGPIQISDSNAVTLTSVGTLSASSIPANIFSAPKAGGSFTVLHTSGGVGGNISFNGEQLAQGATLTLADGNRYRIDYAANGSDDVTLTRIGSLTSPPPVKPPPGSGSGSGSQPPAAGISLMGRTLVITGSNGDDAVRVIQQGKTLRVYASFLPLGVKFLAFKRSAVTRVLMQLGDGNDVASVGPRLSLPVVMEGGAGDDQLIAGRGRSLLIGGPGRDVLAADGASRRGSILIGGSTAFDANDAALDAVLAEWSSSRPRRSRIAELTSGSGNRRLDGDAFLNSATLVDDQSRDVLLGNPRLDWLLPGTDDVVLAGSIPPARSRR